ncbi:MAG: hypothetical protein LBL62_05055 [Planctomycetaceae bacterium]|nr:hypothetical protein [Planctomycetaceae bacterium]
MIACFLGSRKGLYSSRFKIHELITEAQQREAVTQGRSLPPIPATVYYLVPNCLLNQ